ncbi:28S ribosomal protein S23, putative [Ixodes scapularis]|uniref:Small ribosomal subunit protein mS23 n=1 Tax=Ixodes scapularis TaxID=6945 RepID=B7P266_IXOSC|nr:28S ribosomal protein S23, putative [Ixodes scapularis]|eukprot:XP_002401604.1 28S ribosomal protein S23, putative [Ixodes scapularis]
MAGSRIHKLGTIFTRAEGLLKAGGMTERPLWYDVYAAFPPIQEPDYYRKAPAAPVRNICYPEDTIRARFGRDFGQGPVADNLLNPAQTSLCQRFVERYQELSRQRPELSEDAVYEAVKEDFSYELSSGTGEAKENIHHPRYLRQPR